VEGINRTDEHGMVATARMRVVVSDRSVRAIGWGAFSWCSTLVKVMALFVEEVGTYAFVGTKMFHHATLSEDTISEDCAFLNCLSLYVLAASFGIDFFMQYKTIPA